MNEDIEKKIGEATDALTGGAQALADASGEHIELAVGMYGKIFYKFYHPATCPAVAPKQLEADTKADLPKWVEDLFERDGDK